MRHDTSGRRVDKTTPRRTARQLVVGGFLAVTMTVALGLFAAPVTYAHDQSGDHVGCITASSGHYKQYENGWVTYRLENGGSQSAWEAAGTNAWINIPGFWAGGWWSITGTHPQSGTAWMHCH